LWLLKVATDVTPVGAAKVAAAVLYKGRVVAIGVCRYKSHPYQKQFGRDHHSIYLHAEVDVLIKAKRRLTPSELSKSTLLVARVKSIKGEYVAGLAKPCEGCQRAIRELGVKNVIYTQ
jgi:deoxycytidylate deaminase